MYDQSDYRYGTAAFANQTMLARAGLYKAKDGLFLGYDEHRRACYVEQQASILLSGGARCGKSNFITSWLVDGHYKGHVISLDWKGQNGSIAQLQVLQNRRVINFAPRGVKNIIAHHINPISYIFGLSSSLIPDAKLFAASFISLSGNPRAEYFEINAQRFLVAVTVTKARQKGREPVTLPELADLMAMLGSLTDEWLNFEELLVNSPDAFIRQVAVELIDMRDSNSPDAGGFSGIKGEISKSFFCMSDPELRAAVSAPFDFCLSEFTRPNAKPIMLNIMESMEFAETSGAIIKSIYAALIVYKRRDIDNQTLKQFWLLDEIGNIGKWSLAITIATYAAGLGIQAAYITQSLTQLDNLGRNAAAIIMNSCGTHIFKGIRGYQEALQVSNSLGVQTLEIEDFQTNEQAKIANQNSMVDAIMNGGDPFEAGMNMAQQTRNLEHKTKIQRQLLSPDEVMNMPQEFVLVFMAGVLEHPAKLYVPNYWQRRDLAGRYLGDPYHSPDGKVEVRGMFWQSFKEIIREPVPDQYADLPQYKDGFWNFVKGFRP